jgi:hypothetical protein
VSRYYREMASIELFALIVTDYDAAILFVEVLQFALVEDTPSLTNDGRRKRWVGVRSSALDQEADRVWPFRAACRSAVATRAAAAGDV